MNDRLLLPTCSCILKLAEVALAKQTAPTYSLSSSFFPFRWLLCCDSLVVKMLAVPIQDFKLIRTCSQCLAIHSLLHEIIGHNQIKLKKEEITKHT